MTKKNRPSAVMPAPAGIQEVLGQSEATGAGMLQATGE
jgi:hypothetical protein